ncbi:MAG: OmpA family protein [Actinomycetota bacterium]|nr:OmpA family protein [Actinomycetota bacterium]
MTALSFLFRSLRAAALVPFLILGTGSAASAQSSPGLPSPRVVNLPARVATLQARVVDVAPKQTAPNTFAVNTDVLFAFNASDLSPDAQAVLASVVQQLQKSQPGMVLIVGYTDSIGDANYNIGLSQRRAASVQGYLQPNVNNPGLTYQTQGLGEADPVAPNMLPNGQDNPAGRQQNRRVIITYTPR